MTVIVAVNDKQNKQIILGSDTQTTCGQIKSETESKIITKEVDVVDGYDKKIKSITLHIAICGRAYMKNFIQYGFDAPKMKDSMTIIEYLYKDFLPTLTKKLGNNKLIKERNNQSDSQSEMLIVCGNEIFTVEPNFGVIQCSEDYITDGSGWEIALGSLHTSLKLHPEIDKKEAVKNAIIAAGELTVYCNTNVKIKCINY